MKQRWLVFLSVFLLMAALGCKKENAYNNDTASTSVSSSDTSGTTTTTDTNATAGTAGTVGTSATTTGSTGGTASNMDPADKDFVMKVAQGGQAEVTLGNMAASKAQSADVKTFGNRMVTDHSKANDELKQLATNKGLTLPADLGPHQKDADELGKKSGKDFDKAYMEAMVKDHEKDVKEFEDESKKAKDADLKAWVTKTLPTLQEHLKMAKDTQKKVK
jgi:putative membrane protein